MIAATAVIALSGVGAFVAWVYGWRTVAAEQFERLSLLGEQSVVTADETSEEIDWARSAAALKTLGDRLGKAGFLTRWERNRARLALLLLLIVPLVLGVVLGVLKGSPVGTLVGLGVGLYLGATCALGWLRYRTADFEREVLFQVPLVLESLILLVEAGLSMLPALERIVSREDHGGAINPVTRIMRLVYELAAHGIPLGSALEMVAEAANLKVLRHVLLHLDITGTEGGELVPALRSLSDHAHTEWRLSVEYRVKRLENLVVFPVFAAVIGLMFLTASVPLVPVLKVRDSLAASRTTQSDQSMKELFK